MKRRARQYPQVIVFKEKHGDRYFLAHSEDEFYGAFMQVFVERYTAGYWFGDEDIQEYRAELDSFKTEGERAYFFMQMRGDWEYEGFECFEPEVVRNDEVETDNLLSEEEATS